MFPNGSVVLDDTTLVVAESFGHRLSAFDIAPDGTPVGTARLGEVRRAARRAATPPRCSAQITIAPDGIGADAEGAIWVADALNHRVVRAREGEGIVDEISTGEQGAFACMLGGDDGRTLFICAAPSFAEHERVGATDAQLLAVRVDVPARRPAVIQPGASLGARSARTIGARSARCRTAPSLGRRLRTHDRFAGAARGARATGLSLGRDRHRHGAGDAFTSIPVVDLRRWHGAAAEREALAAEVRADLPRGRLLPPRRPRRAGGLRRRLLRGPPAVLRPARGGRRRSSTSGRRATSAAGSASAPS